MTAGKLIELVDELRPNHYGPELKLMWLRRLDGQIYLELIKSHENAPEEAALPESYTEDSQLLAPEPYCQELYCAYLFCQIDLNNAEIQKYNQSASLMSAAWRQFADHCNRENMPRSKGRFRF